ncbi:hypothetical protein EC988_007293 [Linderina pennispora]|nr:hypothetical protein EC988_007293 [Linderina pennispora]
MDIQSLFSISGKVAVVTGGGSGVGYMISEGFVKNGAKVYIISRKAAVLEKAAATLNAMGPGQCIALPGDLQDASRVADLGAKLAELEPSGIDILVNNSGANWATEDLASYPDSAWTKVLGLNLQRVFTMTQQLLPLLERRGTRDDPSRIINIGSINGLTVTHLITPAYSASKAGVHHLTRVLAANLGGKHVTANAIAPGPFESHMMAATLKNEGSKIVSGIPSGRIGRPSDIAGLCVMLSSRGGSYINGAVIPLDGGSTIANQTYDHAKL